MWSFVALALMLTKGVLQDNTMKMYEANTHKSAVSNVTLNTKAINVSL